MSLEQSHPQAAYSIEEVIKLSGIKRTKLYDEIKTGRLKIRKCGARSLVLADELKRWLTSLPEV